MKKYNQIMKISYSNFFLKFFLILIFFFKTNLFFAQIANNKIDVKEYIITLDFTNMQNELIRGNTNILLSPTENNLSNFGLELLHLQIDSITLNGNMANFSYNDTILNFQLSENFNIGDEMSVFVYYHGHPIRGEGNFGGFYFSGNYAFNMGVSLNDIPHNFGKVWFPCNDNFTDRAKYHFFITTTSTNTAVCNGELLNTFETDTSKTYEWQLNEEIPTYLASVAVSNFSCYTSEYEGIMRNIPINIYKTNISNVAGTFVNLNSAISIFENLFGEYRWNRVGYVAVPFNAGAMEHATNIAIGNDYVTGTTTYETVFYHELAHHWFGDLITCSSAEDMWINEGISSYCETLFTEFHYGKNAGKNYRRSSHLKVIKNLSFIDGAFLPISPMPVNLTYSNTIYDKGASVAHALRGYLGDTLFFGGMKEFLSQNAFKDITSYDLRDFLSTYSGINLTNFFNDWVFTGGFVHYAIDSVTPQMNISEIASYKVNIRQKLRGRELFANSNRVELTFMDAGMNTQTRIMEFDGEYGEEIFNFTGFFPILVLCDLNEKLSDATTDCYNIIHSTGNVSFPNTYTSNVNVTNINSTDSAFLRITHNLVPPDDFKSPVSDLVLIKSRYWLIEGLFPNNFKTSAFFTYNTSSSEHLDYGFINNSLDSLVLLYRANKSENWTIEPAVHSSSLKRFMVDSLKIGEYALGIYDWNNFIHNSLYENNDKILIFPNPANNEVNIIYKESANYYVEIIDSASKIISLTNSINTTCRINTEKLKNGVYFIKITDKTQGKTIIEKLIIEK
ncbi:MAG: T9SS type A sorting domain-containing protein [Bacteroidales bacterium]|jgi:aminopeptidase N|nr:T9SS type A sorting domain-containing protein [Bacteroidales bacterium]